MKFTADLHIHSHFSMATSKDLNPEHLSKWAQLKGIALVGTGDIAHPGWLEEMKTKLEPAEDGLFALKRELADPIQKQIPPACHAKVRFMLAGEISNIYKKNDKVRKIHNVVFLPSFDAVERFQARLEKIGNIRSDGRPILGLDSRDLLEIVLETDPDAHLIPAHIWTPWFALLGSKSGFDSVSECFDDLAPHIFALETGLSSDPPMNWRLSALDPYTLVSNSDAHSPQKLAREANLFDTELSYSAVFSALKNRGGSGFLGTIEFFPQEGKYHFDGHRKCGINWDPETTLEHDGICPECGSPVTVGVMHRVQELADRKAGARPEGCKPFYSLVPLPEVISEISGVGVNTKRVREGHDLLLKNLGSELSILREIPVEDIGRVGGAMLAEGIRRMRSGEVRATSGYDGEYGIIRLFEEDERERYDGETGLFPRKSSAGKKAKKAKPKEAGVKLLLDEADAAGEGEPAGPAAEEKDLDVLASQIIDMGAAGRSLFDLNPQQTEAATCTDVPLVVVAGPGTGKTRTVTHRMAHLVLEKGVEAAHILGIAFTNKACEEMKKRLFDLLPPAHASQIMIKTFHAFALMVLRSDGRRMGLNPNVTLCSETDRRDMLRRHYPDMADKKIAHYLDKISRAKIRCLTPASPEIVELYKNEMDFINVFLNYELTLQKNRVLDYDDLILRCVLLFEKFPVVLEKYHRRFRWISVDEYQDVNLAQYRMLRLLAAPDANLCVIGDPDQAIYGFRGADRGYFLRFKEDYPSARIMHLDRNYRSTQLILDASLQVIVKSAERRNIEIWSNVVSRTKVETYQALSDKAEAAYVVQQIESMVGGTSYYSLDSGRVSPGSDQTGRSFSFADFAVLFRLGAQSQVVQDALQRSGMPYQNAGSRPLHAEKDIAEILSFLWLSYNPDSMVHLEKALRAQKIDGELDALNSILALADQNQMPVAAALERIDELVDIKKTQKKRLQQVAAFLDELKTLPDGTPVTQRIELVSRFQQRGRKQGEKYKHNLARLMTEAQPFEDMLEDFLEAIALKKEADHLDPRADHVSLLTLHAAKGLEFPVTFIIGCEEGLLPYQHDGSEADIEEERRLLYVGMTRAQDRLILSHARTRFLYGRRMRNKPSRFLNDIGLALKEVKRMTPRSLTAKQRIRRSQMELF